MNNLEKRLNSLGLEIKSSKSNIMVFNNKPDRDNKIRMRIKGKRIGNVRSAKFLGVTFDSKVKFGKQLTQIQNKTDNALSIMRYMCRVSWGMETNTALMIYRAYVRSILEYGLFIYYTRAGAVEKN